MHLNPFAKLTMLIANLEPCQYIGHCLNSTDRDDNEIVIEYIGSINNTVKMHIMMCCYKFMSTFCVECQFKSF